MNRTSRFILFLVFLFTFLVSAPLVVLYTAGYRFDFSVRSIVHTGVLNVSSFPKNATVWIDGVQQKNKTPSVIDTVIPGNRQIKITKDGYSSWTKTLPIESRETTFIYNAVLFLQSEREQEDERIRIVSKRSNNGHNLAYLIHEGSWIELWLIDGMGQDQQLLARLPYELGALFDISWSAEDNYLALAQTLQGIAYVSIVDIAHGTTIETHSALKNAEAFWWDAGKDDRLNIQLDENIYRLSMSNPNTADIIPFNPQTVMERDQLIMLSENTDRMVLARLSDTQTTSIITYLPYGTYQFVPSPSNVATLEDLERERVILVDLTGSDQPILLNKTMAFWQWDITGDHLLYSDGYNLEVYTRSTHTTQTLTRFSEPVVDLLWYPLGNTIIYAAAGEIVALDLDTRSGHLTTVLHEGRSDLIWVDDKGEFLFFSEEVDGQVQLFRKRLQR